MTTAPALPQPFALHAIPGTESWQIAVNNREVAKVTACDGGWEAITRHASKWSADPADALRHCLSDELRRVSSLIAGAAALGIAL